MTLDGEAKCWGGYDNWPDCANESPPGETFTQITRGMQFGCGLLTDETALCWGCIGSAAPPGATFTQIDAGSHHVCGVTTDGDAVCWGENEYGETEAPAAEFTMVAAGTKETCGLRVDGSIECWGFDPEIHVDPYDIQDECKYGDPAPSGTNFELVTMFASHACALRADGTAACWGSNCWGQASPP